MKLYIYVLQQQQLNNIQCTECSSKYIIACYEHMTPYNVHLLPKTNSEM